MMEGQRYHSNTFNITTSTIKEDILSCEHGISMKKDEGCGYTPTLCETDEPKSENNSPSY